MLGYRLRVEGPMHKAGMSMLAVLTETLYPFYWFAS